MSARFLTLITQQIAALREEEAKDDCWFMLPAEDDDSVDYTRFDVQIDGPAFYQHIEKERQNPYADGTFRVQITIPSDFPVGSPSIVFKTRIWHPMVDVSTGKLCKDALEGHWKSLPASERKIGEVLRFVYGILSAPQIILGDVINQEAANQINNLDEFDARAKKDTEAYAIN